MGDGKNQKQEIKGIKKGAQLEKFKDALSIISSPHTKKAVKSAGNGNWEEYETTVKGYRWEGTQDYNMVLMIFSPVVCAAQAVINYANEHDSKLSDEMAELKEMVEKVMNHTKFVDLCKAIGRGYGEDIEDILEVFSDYKTLMQKLSGGLYGRNGDKFMKAAAKITPWRVNGKYIKQKLIPFVQYALDNKFVTALRGNVSLDPFIAEMGDYSDSVPKNEYSELFEVLATWCTGTAGTQKAQVFDALIERVLKKYGIKYSHGKTKKEELSKALRNYSHPDELVDSIEKEIADLPDGDLDTTFSWLPKSFHVDKKEIALVWKKQICENPNAHLPTSHKYNSKFLEIINQK